MNNINRKIKNMPIKSIAAFSLLIMGLVLAPVQAVELKSENKKSPPNILFVFADDWGFYSDAYAKVDKTTP